MNENEQSRFNLDVIRLWVDALRSGAWPQTTGALNLNGGFGFCCLGVLCELAVNEGVIPSGVPGDCRDGESSLVGYGEENNKFGLPAELTTWAGFTDLYVDNPDFGEPTSAGYGISRITVVGLNDRLGKSFAQIADAIEATYLSDGDQ